MTKYSVKLVTTWDEYELVEKQIKYIKENPEDFEWLKVNDDLMDDRFRGKLEKSD